LYRIVVKVPVSIKEWCDHITDFNTLMMHKLDRNSHKSTPTKEDLAGIMRLLRAEIEEFEEQIRTDKFAENSLLELADIANYAFLAYVALISENKQQEDLFRDL